jgi:hypothetical protein
MHIHDNSFIPKLLGMLARNVEGGALDIKLHAERNDTGWQLWGTGLQGTWYLHVVKGAQHWTSDTLVAELRIGGYPMKNLFWPVYDYPSQFPNDILRYLTKYFIREAQKIKDAMEQKQQS